MTRDELFELTGRHVAQVWAEHEGPIGAGHLVLARYGIVAEHAMELCWSMAQSSSAYTGDEAELPHLCALAMQGLILGLWLAEQVPARSAA